ncbi:MAG: glycosyltransferase [Proteobacteria bacterium]|nr:glycosyltransferase [Pseudomonadota bacterium]
MAQENTESMLIVVPVYNHAATLRQVLINLQRLQLPILVVNDGSQDQINEIRLEFSTIPFLDHSKNLGKGAAIHTGMRYAEQHGFEAILTFDADGQHLPSDIPVLRQAAEQNPKVLIIGARDFASEASGAVPGSSKFGRIFSNFWIWVETGHWLADTQSGLRVYPVDLNLLDSVKGRRYSFEIEVITKALWSGMTVTCTPVKVYYPPKEQRVSHFHAFKDNLRLSRTHTWLCCLRILKIIGLYRNPQLKKSRQHELKGMGFSAWIIRSLGPKVAYCLLIFPVLTSFLFRSVERQALVQFYSKVRPQWNLSRMYWAVLQNYAMFAASIIDRINSKGIQLVPVGEEQVWKNFLVQAVPQGSIMLGAHFGDWMLIARKLQTGLTGVMGIVMDPLVTPDFFREMVRKLDGRLKIIDPKSDTLSFALQIKEILDDGGRVAFLVDRLPNHTKAASLASDFFGQSTQWLRSPFLLATRLKVPVLFICATKEKFHPSANYQVSYKKLWDGLGPMAETQLLDRYTRSLESEVKRAPQHWFNFFPFW